MMMMRMMMMIKMTMMMQGCREYLIQGMRMKMRTMAQIQILGARHLIGMEMDNESV